jgi:L-threonylcarbamoyladenylate synthase
MNTLILQPNKKGIKEAAEIINFGGIVAFPTETVYGLGANAFNEKAIEKIFIAKNRPQDNPLIVHISKITQLKELSEPSPISIKLAKKFWPGPLTIVVKKTKKIPLNVTAGLNTVAVRLPSNKIALKLISESKLPIAAPSANLSGKPSPTKVSHVINDLFGRVDAIISGGDCVHGLESTVVDTTVKPMVLLRPGKITFEQLEKFLGKGKIIKHSLNDSVSKTKSPGMKYKHYSPKAEVILLSGKKEKIVEKIIDLSENSINKKQKIGVISKQKIFIKNKNVIYMRVVSEKRFAKELFHLFREMDSFGVKKIFVEETSEKGLGLAIMNRLKKAAKQTILCV